MTNYIIAICGVVALFVLLFVMAAINGRHKRRILDEATETTTGQIIDVKFYAGDRDSDCYFYWKVRYSVGDAQYTLKSGDSGMTKWAMEMHLGETVDVFYVPGDPRKAHATVHGVTAWSGVAP